MTLTAKRLHELFRYDPVTGKFKRRQSTRGPSGRAGMLAGGSDNRGRVKIKIDGRKYLAHRLAWLYQTGEWPPKGLEIDHRDGNPDNNAWSNLRLASHAQNIRNSRRPCTNKTAYKGVSRIRKSNGKYRAQIKIGGVTHNLGAFTNRYIAHLAYKQAAKRLFGEYARFG
jgi:hypothetical protein